MVVVVGTAIAFLISVCRHHVNEPCRIVED